MKIRYFVLFYFSILLQSAVSFSGTRGSSYDLSGFFTTVATPPVITSFTPTIGHTGTSVSINGTDFTGATSVMFNGIHASFIPGALHITATVPAGATTGLITVTTPAGSADSPFAFVVDNTPPDPPVITGTSPVSPSNTLSPLVEGTTEPGATIKIYTNGSCSGSPAGTTVADISGFFSTSVTVPSNSSTVITAIAVDGVGNPSLCSSSLTYITDNTAPSPPLLTGTTPASPANNSSPTVHGSAEPGSTLKLYTNGSCTDPPALTLTLDNTGLFDILLSVPAGATTHITAAAVDSAGNSSACSTALLYRDDNSDPLPPVITGSSPASPANNNSPHILGTSEPGAGITLYTDPSCTGPPAGTGTANASGIFSILVTVGDNTSTAFYAHAADTAGNVSLCSSNGFTYVENSNLNPNSICGFKYSDRNGNGIYEPGLGESGISGWEILAVGVAGDTLRTTTDAAGAYCFGGLVDTTYTVYESPSPGIVQTGGQPFYRLPIGQATQLDSVSFGNFKSGKIYGTKFNDANGNGVRDNGDDGLNNWTICLLPKQNPPGIDLNLASVVMDVTLDGVPMSIPMQGHVAIREGKFENILNGTPLELQDWELKSNTPVQLNGSFFDVSVDFELPGGVFPRSFGATHSSGNSFFDVFFEIDLDEVGPGGGCIRAHNPQAYHLASNTNVLPFSPGTSFLGGTTALLDSNGQAYGSLQSFTLNIGQQISPTSPLCVSTDTLGNYSFVNLFPGTYNIREQSQPCWLQTSPNPPTMSVTSGDSVTGIDFGNQPGGGRICVTKYYDGNHNQQVDPGELPMGGITFHLNGVNPTHVFSSVTDVNGKACFDNLPVDDYTLTESVPPGYEVILPKPGVGYFAISGCERDSVLWLNTARYTDSTFRTATPEQWAMAVDHSNKRKAVKCKPDKVDFVFNMKFRMGVLKMKFPMATSAVVRMGKNNPNGAIVSSWDSVKDVTIDFDTIPAPGQVFEFTGTGFKGKPMTVTYQWLIPGGGIIDRGSLPLHPSNPEDAMKVNTLRLPMPNLHNVGEDLQKLGKFPITIGAKFGAHSVTHLKYTDVQKSLVKVSSGIPLFHFDSTHCLDVAKGREIKKQLKALPPDPFGGNKLFAEVLALKLNIMASEEDRFPHGLGDLIYDYSSVDPSPLDSASVDDICLQADSMLMCDQNPKLLNLLPVEYYVVVHRINLAFASSEVDTESWSCNDLALKGVRTLKSIPFLRANPGAIQPGNRPRIEHWNEEPVTYLLKQNYPNPFNPTTAIQFDLYEPAKVSLKVYNTLGQEIATLIDDQVMDDGTQEVEFDASGLTSGVYFYRIIADGISDPDEGTVGKHFVSVKKMVLLK